MARVAVALSCTAEVVIELERLARSRSGEVRMAERARIVLACLRGKRNDEVAIEIGVRPNTVGQWRRRFAANGLAGLRDAPRPGKPVKYGVELRGRILAQLELPPPSGMASWDGGSLALALSVSDDAVWPLEVATGIVRGKTTQTKKRADFQAFMEEVVQDQPAGRQIHVILDNLNTHKKNDDWLAAHPNVTFHFTPTSASWLNQVEIWFGIFQRKTLNNASFNSIEQLSKAIHDFTDAYNENAAPFVWRKREVRGAQLRNTIVNLRN